MNASIVFTVASERTAAGDTVAMNGRVCPESVAPWLDNPVRRWVTGSRRLARRYLSPGMTVLDVGCGPAPMLVDIVRAIGPGGRLICVDIQRGMLERVARKVVRLGVCDRVRLHLSHPDDLGLEPGLVDVAIAFWMVHEAPDPHRLLGQIRDTLKPAGRFLMIEPAMHVSKQVFNDGIAWNQSHGMMMEHGAHGWMNRMACFTKCDV
ncbi:methyltransferase domain-containing protein [bacterium]|nr:methyltransferase domain-containing protein [candidate division CSSED10-310 bacterium]